LYTYFQFEVALVYHNEYGKRKNLIIMGGCIMESLRQWICDNCGEIIEKPEDGYVFWKSQDMKNYDFHIVHHVKCNLGNSFTKSMDLGCFLGADGLVRLLAMLDPGPMHQPNYQCEVSDMREFVEFFRRVQLPYYEEARIYWQDAKNDDFFSDANELRIYLPSTLQELIQLYRVTG